MEILAMFLTISLITLLVISPKEIKEIKLYTFLVPLVLFSIVIICYALLFGAFFAGKAFAQSILPLIVSFIVLFYGFRNKLKAEKQKFPLLLLIAILITWGIAGYTYYLKSEINNYFSKTDIAEKLSNLEPITPKNKIREEIKYLDANYKGLSIKLPETWNFKPNEVANDNRYQLLCWDKNGFNTFVITEIELLMKLEDLLNFMKISIGNYKAYKNCVFEPYESGQLNNNKTLICRYSGIDNGKEFNGKLIVFVSNSKTYLIIYQGGNQFFSDGTPEKIISSLIIGNPNNNQENLNSLEIPTDWTIYEIDNIGKIAIPPSMEIRDSSSCNLYVANSVKDNLPVHQKIAMIKPTLLFQAKGMNKGDIETGSIYSEIIIKCYKGKSGDFYEQNAKFSSSEKVDMNNSYKNEVESSFSGFGIKLVQWFPFDVVTIDKSNWHKISYIRQTGNNQPIYVTRFKFNNDNEAIEIVLSYRNSEKTIWGNDFNTIINSFRKQ